MNPWPIYSEMKVHWRDTQSRLTEQELKQRFPQKTDEEIQEGMLEFELAFNRSLPFEPTKAELEEEPV